MNVEVKMGKKMIRHMGMTMTEEEHRKWHEQHEGGELTPQEHARLMKRLGVGEEEDREWHQAQGAGAKKDFLKPSEDEPVDVLAVGAGFVAYCVKQGWLIQRGRGQAKKHFVTAAGREALAEFGIVKL
jgi:hypothetical protein